MKTVKKTWGKEEWLVNDKTNNYCGKILTIKPNKATSMHFHSNKHETFYVLEGELELDIIDTDTNERSVIYLEKGNTYVMERNTPHKLGASGKKVKLVEFSTFHEDTDSYRVGL
jgi:quercetin dioxygenase-like cupin family protein|tara:strand:+ start:135 stop:476 length:342 start_codon:yes stop_codon:yes gene_type:complete